MHISIMLSWYRGKTLDWYAWGTRFESCSGYTKITYFYNIFSFFKIFSKMKFYPRKCISLKHILALPTWGLTCTDFEEKPFEVANFDLGHPGYLVKRPLWFIGKKMLTGVRSLGNLCYLKHCWWIDPISLRHFEQFQIGFLHIFVVLCTTCGFFSLSNSRNDFRYGLYWVLKIIFAKCVNWSRACLSSKCH